MSPICYIIPTNSNIDEIIHVLTILFAAGYVFDEHRRINSIEKFLKISGGDIVYADKWKGWNFIAIPNDRECKMVLDAYINNIDERWIELSVEEYMKTIHNTNV